MGAHPWGRTGDPDQAFRDDDVDILVEILRLKGQYDHPEIEVPDGMKRATRAVIPWFPWSWEEQPQPRGFIRSVYDGGACRHSSALF